MELVSREQENCLEDESTVHAMAAVCCPQPRIRETSASLQRGRLIQRKVTEQEQEPEHEATAGHQYAAHPCAGYAA